MYNFQFCIYYILHFTIFNLYFKIKIIIVKSSTITKAYRLKYILIYLIKNTMKIHQINEIHSVTFIILNLFLIL